jgi:hypothetical protein
MRRPHVIDRTTLNRSEQHSARILETGHRATGEHGDERLAHHVCSITGPNKQRREASEFVSVPPKRGLHRLIHHGHTTMSSLKAPTGDTAPIAIEDSATE